MGMVNRSAAMHHSRRRSSQRAAAGRVEEHQKGSPESIMAIRNICIYISFMIFFCIDTTEDLTDDLHFYFAEVRKSTHS